MTLSAALNTALICATALLIGCDQSESRTDNYSQRSSQVGLEYEMHKKLEVEEKWDFYPCRVENRPGSMSVDMAFINHSPIDGAGTIYWIDYELPDPGEHGMGNDLSFDLLRQVDDNVVEFLDSQPFYYVGRLRNSGLWTMYFFGPEGLDESIQNAAKKAVEQFSQVSFTTGSKADADWKIYTDFIYPGPERHRWMRDRSVVDVLAENGDLHDVPRRIDHWIYFESRGNRDAMANACKLKGFSIESRSDDNSGERPYGLQIFREDPAELSHINSVTNMITDIASTHCGDYDGWETFIVRDKTVETD